MNIDDVPMNRAANGAPAPKFVLPFLAVGTLGTAEVIQFVKSVDVIVDVSPYLNEEEEETAPYNAPAKSKAEYINLRFNEEADEEGAEDEEEERDARGKLHQKAFKLLKDLKAADKKVLVVSTDRQLVIGVVLSYMLYSSQALDKYLPLTKAMAFAKTKDPQFIPDDGTIISLAVLEEELYDEVSVPLPSNSRGGNYKKSSNKNKKPSANKGRR